MPGSTVSPHLQQFTRISRRMPIGADVCGERRCHIRVWAPAVRRVDVVPEEGDPVTLHAEERGYFSGFVELGAGARYWLRLGTGDALYADPASRYQPDGPHGASEIVDPATFRWTDAAWRGVPLEGQVIYEMHVGTFTAEGTWAAAMRELPELARIGITTIEMMPVAEFAGRRGWGYDGVNKFAPSHLYGQPDDLRRFVDRAHALGLAVILDVVYNHLGPVGNYLKEFSPAYFTAEYETDWGDAINFDGDDAAPVREFFVTNAAYWVDEFHMDGLRLDATQSIFDRSREHVLAAIGKAARRAATGRQVVVIAENEPQDTRLVRPIEAGGYGLDGLWNDDFHHSAVVALTGRAEAYYSDTRGVPQELVSAVKYGFLFQGQHYAWQQQSRGTPSWGIGPAAFVAFLENHDQVANAPGGFRLHQMTSPGRFRAMTALLLLAPWTPLLFQGQEFSASAPFLFFVDFDRDLAEAVRKGRGDFLAQFPSQRDCQRTGSAEEPSAPDTFERCKLDFGERERHAAAYALHQDLLRLRREDAAFARQRAGGVDGSVLSSHACALRFFTPDHADDRLLIVNLGTDLCRDSVADPLVAPPADCRWQLRWSSEDKRYGGRGTAPLIHVGRQVIPGESAVVLSPSPAAPRRARGRNWPSGQGMRRP